MCTLVSHKRAKNWRRMGCVRYVITCFRLPRKEWPHRFYNTIQFKLSNSLGEKCASSSLECVFNHQANKQTQTTNERANKRREKLYFPSLQRLINSFYV